MTASYKILFFQEHQITLNHIESRINAEDKGKYEFFVSFRIYDKKKVKSALDRLKSQAAYLHVLSQTGSGDTVHWFPQKIRDLDRFANRILSYGAELESDHPVSFNQR